jgi:hypothetical protein
MAGNKALWEQVKPTDVVVEDRNLNPVKVGSIVEIVDYGDGYRGLFYVVGIEAGGGRSIRLLLARTRFDKWEIKVAQPRASVRVYSPFVGKGE